MRTRFVLVLLLAIGVASPLPQAFAHGMHATVAVTETELRITAKYDDGEAVGEATIELFREREATDCEGNYK